ncbi:hypothetical protein AVEN_261538-1, partial [Araneus ventricosus]
MIIGNTSLRAMDQSVPVYFAHGIFTSFVVTWIVSNYFMDSSFVYLEQSRTSIPPEKSSDCPRTSEV